MEIMVNAVKFKADEKLVEFIEKKMKKVATLLPQAMKAEVTLKVDKDQSEKNKIGEVRVLASGEELFASKQCDTFEEAVDLCLDALKKQIEKLKERYNK
ncbi:HPF/RaiA family ribosome-associated protein [bacterium]|nr:HPF/RaiA family ribosome-associated protein [bacterium]